MGVNLDKTLLTIIIALGAISVSVIFASSRSLAQNQLIFWAIGLAILYLTSHLYYPQIKKLPIFFYGLSIAALLLVLIVADPIRGSTRWIDLGIFRIQPSEIAKISAILALATFYLKRSAANTTSLALSFLLILPIFILIFVEPDIGSAMAIIAVWLGVSFAAGIKKKQILILAIISAFVVLASFNFLASYQKERISTFIDPSKDPLGSGYNVIQSQIAVGSGKLLGSGLGKGTQSNLEFLPEPESDFIFASTAEQLGFIGTSLLVTLFALMILKLIKIGSSTDRFGQLIIYGAVSLLLYQFFVNTGVNMGLLPVTGITLPLVSYGGSSLISTLFLIGLVISIERQQGPGS